MKIEREIRTEDFRRFWQFVDRVGDAMTRDDAREEALNLADQRAYEARRLVTQSRKAIEESNEAIKRARAAVAEYRKRLWKRNGNR